MAAAVDHVVLTRFNVPTPGVESLIRAKEGWLRGRMELFERFTVPSMRRQTAAHTWIVYFDPESPQWLQDRIAELSVGGLFVPVYREAVPHDALIADIRRYAPRHADELLTTNLDNDDGLADDFLAQLQAAAVPELPSAIYLTEGLIIRGMELYARTDLHNAFCSVREGWAEPRTCWADWHNRLGNHMAVLEVEGRPAWLQVVHGSNVSNRVQGRRVAPDRFRAGFAGLLDDVAAPRAGEMISEVLVRRPGRQLRESGRSVGKQAILAVGGKNGLDRIKAMAGRVRS